MVSASGFTEKLFQRTEVEFPARRSGSFSVGITTTSRGTLYADSWPRRRVRSWWTVHAALRSAHQRSDDLAPGHVVDADNVRHEATHVEDGGLDLARRDIGPGRL